MLAERCDTKSQFSKYGYVLIRLFPQWKLKLNALLKQKNTLFSQKVSTQNHNLSSYSSVLILFWKAAIKISQAVET